MKTTLAIAYLFLDRPEPLFALLAIALAGSIDAAQVREYRYTHGELETLVVHKQMPQYPVEAQRRNQRGQCYVRLYVARDGTVTRVKILQSTGYELLDASCMQAFGTWRFKRGLRREIDVPISFVKLAYGEGPPGQRRPTIVREFRD